MLPLRLGQVNGQKEFEAAGGTWATGGRAEGGLMTTPKPKKKRGRPKKSGLAGKK